MSLEALPRRRDTRKEAKVNFVLVGLAAALAVVWLFYG